ncbi:MAG: hypothetical protein GY787_29900 [Alteromonadales bacterium]|nr:hypothetical protein [Alteromonadales bacterium]
MNMINKYLNLMSAILVMTLFVSLNVQAESKTDVKTGFKEVGFSTLPTFLDAATESITIKMPKQLGGKRLRFGGSIDAEALQQKKFVFTTSDKHKLNWQNAFGLSFLDLSEVELSLEVEKGAFSISLDGMVSGPLAGHGKKREVTIDLAIEDKKITDFTLSLPDSKLYLHSIHEFRSIPGAHKLAIESPTISMDAIGGKIDFLDETVDSMLFYDHHKKGWNVALRFEKALTLSELTGHKGSFLDHVGLPKSQLLISTKGLEQSYQSLPLAAQNFFTEENKLPEGNLEVEEGVNVIASFDPALAPKDVQKTLKTLGLGSTVLDVDGTVEGMFGHEPAVELNVKIDAPKSHSFKFLKIKHAQAEFFLKLSKDESAIGYRTAIEMDHGKGSKKSTLEFDVDFEFAAQEGEAEVQVAGGMKGDWRNAAGIKGLTLENPFMSVGINETGSFDMLIDGTVMVGKEKIRATADMVLSPEALGLPTAIAFAGTVNKLKFDSLASHAKKHSKLKGGGFKNLNAEFKDVAFAFMTPGAHLPADLEEQLEIEGAGMALSATLLVNNKELGSAKGYASTEGISFDGKLDPFKLGPLALKDAELSIQAGEKVEPKFAMSGDIKLFKGFEDKYDIQLQPSKFEFYSDTKFGGAFDTTIIAKSNGLSFSKSNDFEFEADLAANYSKAFRGMVQGALKGLKKADSAMKKAENDVKHAERSVNNINAKIKSEERKAKHAYDVARKKISDAEHKVNKLKGTISYNKKKAHSLDKKAKHDAKHWKFGRAAKEGSQEAAVKTAVVAEEAALKTALWALKTAKRTVKVVPVDAAPKVVELKAQLVTEQAGLKVAEETLKVSRAANKGVEDAVKAVGKGLTALKINKLGASGSLKGITSGGKQGQKPKLIIDVTIHGKHHVYRETLDENALKSEFKKLGEEIAKEVAKEILKVFEK